jgi:hypothetical protein
VVKKTSTAQRTSPLCKQLKKLQHRQYAHVFMRSIMCEVDVLYVLPVFQVSRYFTTKTKYLCGLFLAGVLGMLLGALHIDAQL